MDIFDQGKGKGNKLGIDGFELSVRRGWGHF